MMFLEILLLIERTVYHSNRKRLIRVSILLKSRVHEEMPRHIHDSIEDTFIRNPRLYQLTYEFFPHAFMAI